MKVTVIIPTYNGGKKIGNILKALERQTFRFFEVIVVIDGSSDNTKEILQRYENGYPLKCVFQENQGRAGARNRGAAEVTNGLIIFFDDDIEPFADCIEKHVEFHEKHIGVGVVGKIYERCSSSDSEIQKFKAWLGEKWQKRLVIDSPLEKEDIYLSAANFSILIDDFKKIGGFDERLFDTEDFDFAVSCLQKGFSIFYNPQARVLHNDILTFESYVARLRQYREAFLQLFQLKPSYKSLGLAPEKPKFYGAKKIFFFIFSFKTWGWLAERGFFKFLPKKIRYKIYDFLLTSRYLYWKN